MSDRRPFYRSYPGTFVSDRSRFTGSYRRKKLPTFRVSSPKECGTNACIDGARSRPLSGLRLSEVRDLLVRGFDHGTAVCDSLATDYADR